MLVQLSIRDIVLIERLDLEFAGGLSVLTGETGAGKSILLDALSLALGARGDGSLVRAGAAQGQVTAVFEPDAGHPVWRLVADNGIASDGALLLRRVQGPDGRTRAYVNDNPVSAALIRQAGRMLVEIHGQHDDRALVDPGAHRELVDAFGRLESRVAALKTAWARWQDAGRAMAELKQRIENGAREADYLRASVAELTKLAPESGEEESLAETRSRLMRFEKIATDVNEANEVLGGGASPLPVLSNLQRRLERKAKEAPGLLDEAIGHLDSGLNALFLAQQSIERALRQTEHDPAELERAEERLFSLRAASRKYSKPVDALADLCVRMADDLAAYTEGGERLQAMETELARLKSEYFGLAETLSEERRRASDALEKSVARELPALKLDNAAFSVEIASEATDAGPSGIDSVEFKVRTNPGTPAGPLMKIASGGELSRFLLALKVSLADRGSAPTLVFDEIDSGIGGAVADAIGNRLKRLASGVQVLSVTHAPQVAAKADTHFLITKEIAAGDPEKRVVTQVAIAGEDVRREEIARMLAGATITQEARAAADRLIRQTAA